jgi:hypothetical protein
MEPFIIPSVITLLGGGFLVRNILLMSNEEKLRHYVENNRKSKMWIARYGLEKTVTLTRKYFLPLGILVSCGWLGAGLWMLFKILRTT